MFLTTDRLGRLTRSRFAAPVAVALAILVLTINEIGYYSVNRATAARDHAADARVIVDQLRRRVIEAESAQRGYLLTQRESYKPDYEKALRELRISINQIDALATRSLTQRPALQRLSRIAQDKVAELEETVRMAETGNRAGALGLVLTDIGREQMQAIDQLADRIAADETSAFATAGVARDRTMHWSRLGIAILVALCLTAVFVALRLARSRERLAIQRESERIEQRNALQLERDKLEEEVSHRTHELTVLATHLQTVREDERSRLARELHDELGGLLTAAKLDVARIKNRLATAGPEVAERIGHLVKTLDAGIALKRRIIEDLRPSSLSNLGLKPALQILCSEFAKRSEIEVVADLDEVKLPEDSALSVYRLVQEALTNVAKYAKAKRVEVDLRAVDGNALVSVTDDGCGFDLDAQVPAGHGLAGMRFRVQSGGGTMTLRSARGRGTRIEAALPIVLANRTVTPTSRP
jgi:signal transduction histidine kinase